MRDKSIIVLMKNLTTLFSNEFIFYLDDDYVIYDWQLPSDNNFFIGLTTPIPLKHLFVSTDKIKLNLTQEDNSMLLKNPVSGFNTLFNYKAQKIENGMIVRGFAVEKKDQSERENALSLSLLNTAQWTWDVSKDLLNFEVDFENVLQLSTREREGLKNSGGVFSFWKEKIHPSQHEEFDSAWRKFLSTDDLFLEIILKIVVGENHWKWFLLKGEAIKRTASGQPLEVFGLILNLTQSMNLEMSFREDKYSYENLLKSAPVSLYECKYNHLWSMIHITSNVFDMTGYTAEEFMDSSNNINFGSIIYEEDKDRVDQLMNDSIGDGNKFELRYRIRHKDGTLRWVWERGQYTDGGQKLQGAMVDVTNEVISKERLEQIHQALNNCTIVVFTDRAGRITFANEKFCEISGYTSEELVGQTHRILRSEVHDSEFYKNMWNTITKGDIWRGEICNRNKNGELYWVDSTIFPCHNLNGKITEFIAIRNDITDRKLAQESLLVNAKMASLGEMAAGVAHEINNPLTIIHGKLTQVMRLLERENYDVEKIRESVNKSIDTTMRISRIVKGLKSFSANDDQLVDMGEFSLEQVMLDLGELCYEKFKNSNIEFTIENHYKNLIFGSDSQILQVLVNLVNNAYDEIKKQEKPWVKITAMQVDDQIKIDVIDSGHGIPKDIKDKIMQPFFTRKKMGHGTGLGLSISKGILDRHKGEIIIDDTCKNTCFTIKFPINHNSDGMKAS